MMPPPRRISTSRPVSMAAMAMKVSLAPDARRIVTGTGQRGPIFAGSASMTI